MSCPFNDMCNTECPAKCWSNGLNVRVGTICEWDCININSQSSMRERTHRHDEGEQQTVMCVHHGCTDTVKGVHQMHEQWILCQETKSTVIMIIYNTDHSTCMHRTYWATKDVQHGRLRTRWGHGYCILLRNRNGVIGRTHCWGGIQTDREDTKK